MDRRSVGEDLYRQKFADFGLAEKFEFLCRDWSSDHGRRMLVRCRACGAEFTTWDEVFKGRQKNLYCKSCGASTGDRVIKARSKEVSEAMRFYVDGHSVKETAARYGFTPADINNYVRRRGLSNGKDWHEAACEVHRLAAVRTLHRCRSKSRTHRFRANKYGCAYDPTVNLKRLIEKNGLRCAICGEMCDPNDHSWRNGIGPMYPTIDHIIPMARHGGHIWSNVQIAHAICNTKKGAQVEEVGA
jgi:5-methylcytosine-specific restriction endonuclease McrA/ribosomal protein S27E